MIQRERKSTHGNTNLHQFQNINAPSGKPPRHNQSSARESNSKNNNDEHAFLQNTRPISARKTVLSRPSSSSLNRERVTGDEQFKTLIEGRRDRSRTDSTQAESHEKILVSNYKVPRPQSAFSRLVAGERSDSNGFLGRPQTASSNSARSSARSNISSTCSLQLSDERIRELNDPLEVSKPYTPHDKSFNKVGIPPFLPKSKDPTVLPFEKPVKNYTKPLVCPDDWIEKSMEPNMFEKCDFKTLLDPDFKKTFAKTFVDRNSNRMWVYDRSYVEKTPQEVTETLAESPVFISNMIVYHRQERALNLGISSKRIYACFDESKLSMNPKLPCMKDPYLASLSTSRVAKDLKTEAAIKSINVESKFRRGYLHAPEYGNFSRFNGILNKNVATTLQR